MPPDREHRSATFDTVARRYDRARPPYPEAVFDAIAARCPTNARVLDIACGTGQATVPLARRGYPIVAVERGPALAALARRNLAPFPWAHVEVAAFEAWRPPDEPFELAVCATAFHWLDPAVRLSRIAAVLRPGGWFALIDTVHVAGGNQAFFADVQACYGRFDPTPTAPWRLPCADDLPTTHPELDGSPLFEPPALVRVEHDIEYRTDAYLDLLRTYSGHLALTPAARRGLLDCIAALIDGRYGGRITKRYLIELRLARRR